MVSGINKVILFLRPDAVSRSNATTRFMTISIQRHQVYAGMSMGYVNIRSPTTIRSQLHRFHRSQSIDRLLCFWLPHATVHLLVRDSTSIEKVIFIERVLLCNAWVPIALVPFVL